MLKEVNEASVCHTIKDLCIDLKLYQNTLVHLEKELVRNFKQGNNLHKKVDH